MTHEKFPSFNWFPRDWLVGTVLLTPEQKGMFADLLSYAWDQTPPCTLPDDDAILAKWAGVSLARWRKNGGVIRKKFDTIGDGLLRNKKQWTIYLQAVENRQRRQKSGKMGAEQRWHSDSNAIAPPKLPIPIPIPITETTKKNRASRGSQLPDGWVPSAGHHELVKKYPGITVSGEVDKFRDHHIAKGSVFKDWDAAFRTWIRNAAKYASTRPQQGSPAAKVRGEVPQSEAPRSDGWHSAGGQKLETQDQIDDRRVAEWRTENPDKAQVLWQECVNEIAEMFAGKRGQFTEVAVKAMCSSKFRARVIAEHLTPRLSA